MVETTGTVFIGTEGNDIIFGGTPTDDYYDLLGGNDIVQLETSGNDTYIGGAGNDFIVDSAGDDHYIFNLGDGNDHIYDITGNDVLEFGEGINDTDLILAKDDQGLLIGLRGTTDSIKIHGWADNDYKIESIRFADGSSLTSSDLDLLYDGTLLLGTNSNDTINGNDLGNIIRAKAGDDVIDGGLGADTMIGGLGNETYYVDNTGDATVEEIGEGIDSVYSSVSFNLGANVENLSLTGSADIDATGNELNNTMIGNIGNNILSGGQGNDVITDASGNDSYLFNLNDGQDIVTDLAGTDSIKFGAGITNSSLTYTQEGNDLVISITNTADKITVKDWYTTAANKIEKFEFADGTYVTSDDIDNPVTPIVPNIVGTDGRDILFGTFGDDIIDALAGNDLVTDFYGKDMVFGGDGSDKIMDFFGNDQINAGTGDDEIMDFSGDDTIIGGTGNDTIHDFLGSDTYIFNKGDGIDTLFDKSRGADIDTIKFGTGIIKEDVAIFKRGANLTIAYGAGDTLTVKELPRKGEEVFQLDNGLFLTDSDINQMIQQMASFAKSNGISFKSVEDVRANQDLMSMVVNSWHS